MKKVPVIIASVVLLSSPLTAFASGATTTSLSNSGPGSELIVNPEFENISDEPTNASPPDVLLDKPVDPIFETITPDYETLPESQILYSGDIGGDDSVIQKPVYGVSSTDGLSKVVVSDGARFTWEYETTTYGSDKLVKNGYSWIATAISGAVTGFGGYAIAALFATPKNAAIASGIATSLWAKGTSGLPSTQYTYWTVKRYVDKDAYNLYKKYVIYVYKDKAKTKLHRSFTEVHSNRYR